MHLFYPTPSDATEQTLVGGDPAGEALLARKRKRDTKIIRLQNRQVEIERELSELRQEEADDIDAYEQYLVDEVLPDRLAPDPTPSIKKRVAKWFKNERPYTGIVDGLEIEDLEELLEDTDWEIDTVTRGVQLIVKLVHRKRVLPDPKQIVTDLVSKVRTILPLVVWPDPRALELVRRPQGP